MLGSKTPFQTICVINFLKSRSPPCRNYLGRNIQLNSFVPEEESNPRLNLTTEATLERQRYKPGK